MWVDILSLYDLFADVLGKYPAGFLIALLVFWVASFAVNRARLPDAGQLQAGAASYDEEVRQYQALRERVGAGGIQGQTYEVRLRSALRSVDRFFHDNPDAKPSPTWTWGAMDRCVLLALIYPLLAMLVGWWISGQPDPVAAALGFPNDTDSGLRALHAVSVGAYLAAAVWLCKPKRSHQTVFWIVARFTVFFGATVGMISLAFTVFGSFTAVFALASIAIVALLWNGGIIILIAVVIYAFVIVEASVMGLAVYIIIMLFGIFVGAILSVVAKYLNKLRPGLDWWLYFPLLLASAPILIALSPRMVTFDIEPAWGLMLMVWALPLVNAVFDWVSLGFTRLLLKNGLARGGWWPLLTGVIDVLVAVVVLFLLVIATLAYVQVLNIAAAAGGFTPVLDVPQVVALLREDPGAPSLWWIYVTVFTTFIPSLVNLTLGALSVLRGVPGVHAFLVTNYLPADFAKFTGWRRNVAALGLSFQWMIGAALALALGFLAIGVLFGIFEALGFGLITVAEHVNDGLAALSGSLGVAG